MTDSIAFAPLFQWIPIVKGMLSGGLLASGILVPYGFPLQAALFVMGALIFVDAIIPRDKEISIMASVIAMIFGGFVSILAAISNLGIFWTVILVAAAILLYGNCYFKKKR